MSNWEAEDAKHSAQLLIGDFYGEHPEERLDEIRSIREKRAARLCKKLGMSNISVVLEIGSGMGFTSKHVAKAVKHLYCYDTSSSFLDIARKECSGIPNIEFLKIDKEPATFSFPDEFFDISFADAVFIYLNLYDIFWYFAEFQRLVKRRGLVCIDVRNASKIDTKLLTQMAGFYREDRDSLKTLLCWNSVGAVITIAEEFGFKLALRSRLWWLYQGATVELIFRKL